MMIKVLVMINDLVLMIKNEYFVMIHVLVVLKWSWWRKKNWVFDEDIRVGDDNFVVFCDDEDDGFFDVFVMVCLPRSYNVSFLDSGIYFCIFIKL